MNIVVLGGRLTNDPEMNTTTTGKSVVRTAVAVRRTDDVTDFVDIELWGKNAENISHICKKGDYILVRGEWRKDSFTGKDGQKKTKQYCVVNIFEKAGRTDPSRDADTGYVQDADFADNEFADIMQEDENLPF